MNTVHDSQATESRRMLAQRHSAKNRRYAKAIAFIAVVVLAGVVIGVGGTVIYFNRKAHRGPPRPEAISEAMLNRMRDLFSLTPDEEKEIKTIVDARLREVEEIRKSSFQEVRNVFEAMDDDMAEKIGRDRVQKWKDYKDKKRRERKELHRPEPEKKDRSH